MEFRNEPPSGRGVMAGIVLVLVVIVLGAYAIWWLYTSFLQYSFPTLDIF